MKTALILVLTGTLVGVAMASLVVPPMLSWYTSPGGLPQGGQIQAVVQIPEVIRYATSKLLWGQTIGGGMGAVMGLLVSLLLRRKAHRESALVPRLRKLPNPHASMFVESVPNAFINARCSQVAVLMIIDVIRTTLNAAF
jgi:hypothetical protein